MSETIDEVDAMEASIKYGPLSPFFAGGKRRGSATTTTTEERVHETSGQKVPTKASAPSARTKPQDEGARLGEQLERAREGLTKAETELTSAQAAFDLSGADAELEALETARRSLSRAREHVGRAERLCEAHTKREAEGARARLVAERDAIRASLRPEVVRAEADRLAALEVDALIRVLEVRRQRFDHEHEIEAQHAALNRVEYQIDPDFKVHRTRWTPQDAPTKHGVARLLWQRAGELIASGGNGTPAVLLRRWVEELVGSERS